MNGILGMNQLLIDSGLDPERERMARIALSSGRSLLNVLNDILDYSKLDAGRLKFEQVPLDLEQVLDELHGLFSPTAENHGLTFGTEVEPGAPVRVLGDPTRPRQILNNLCSNALKFTHEGGVVVRLAAHPLGLSLSVSDTGIGISEEARTRLFDAFEQADASTTRRYGGTGLGLSISMQLCQQMGGELTVESTLGAGSTFTAVLPLEQTDVSVDPTTVDDPSLIPGLRILVAEDHPVNQLLVRRMLEALGADVVLVGSGGEAVVAAEDDGPWDLVLMDVHMPGMDGLEATRQIRAGDRAPKDLPIVALTASAMAEDRERCILAGMDGHLAKPIEKHELAGILVRYGVRREAADQGLDRQGA